MFYKIGITFPKDWQYSPEENEIFTKTAEQIKQKFKNQNNLLINTTWFGPQFNNQEWAKVQSLVTKKIKIDNLFLLSVIDPIYLTDKDLSELCIGLNVDNLYKIGMGVDSNYDWNFHAIVGPKLMPKYKEKDVILTNIEKDFLCYQRKPRPHRVDFTKLLIKNGLDKNGVFTLGGNHNDYDWAEGKTFDSVLIDDSPTEYKHNGSHDDFGGVPNDLVTIGRLDIWNKCFLNISSETVYNHWEPLFVTEKQWKCMIGLRPYIVQGNPQTYKWLRRNGFKTFNEYWRHIDLETSTDVIQDHIEVLKFLATKSKDEKQQMYDDMLPNLRHNKDRFFEFSAEQKFKMENLPF